MIVRDFLKLIIGGRNSESEYPHAKKLRLLLNQNAMQKVDTFCVFDEPTKQDTYVVLIFKDKKTGEFKAVRSTGSYHYESIDLDSAIDTIQKTSFKKNIVLTADLKRQMLLEGI